MATQQHPTDSKPPQETLIKVFFVAIVFCACYFLGSYSNPSSTLSTIQAHPQHCFPSNASTPKHPSPSLVLDFEAHHILPLPKKAHKWGERHCPGSHQALRCLVPRPKGYRRPFPWPKSDRLVFPGGGTSFPKGVKDYVDEIRRVVPLKSGNIRTALDVGCGYSALLDSQNLRFSLKIKLEFPVLFHLSNIGHYGVYLMEIDRVLRPGGYWVVSGPPISWKSSYKGWERKAQDLEKEQISLEDLARRLCWKRLQRGTNCSMEKAH
ncbi:putative methyltransferase PMT15 [Vitis vinifera]|uniref:Methyltransferase n=1 Tax=Vitis vinifera TaxID=29760 RepID=A0A438FIU9_VITVI|nr:putative methyltransferase PMT15 [Vitis vinifera]